MEKKKYFESLISLYEAVGMTGSEEVVPQENIADSGSDVAPEAQNAQAVEDPNIGEDQDIEDAAYLNPQEQVVPEESISLVMETQKAVKLFELVEDLLSYGKAFYDSLKIVDKGLLDEKSYVSYLKYSNQVESLINKIESYLINIYNSETYERNLYTYILYRTELISIVKELRNILKLQDVEREQLEKIKARLAK
jgi:hypothetical protein